jgi:hypothetical protein
VKHGTQQGSFGNIISPNIIEPGLTSSKQLRIHLGISDPYIYNYIYRSGSLLSVSDTDTDADLGHGGSEDGPHNYGTLGPRTTDKRKSEYPRAKSPSAILSHNIYNYTGGAVDQINKHPQDPEGGKAEGKRRNGTTTKISTKHQTLSFC